MYTEFAPIYDRLMQTVDYSAWAAYYDALLRKYVSPGGRVCECACGSGGLTVPLKRLGWQITGTDLSRDMLALAVVKAREAGLDIPFVRQDMCALHVHRPQDAVLCTCDGVNYLLDPRRVRRFFSAAYASLRPGGVLAFDVSTPFKLRNTLGDQTLGSAEEEISYIWQNAWHPRTRRVDMRLSFFVRQQDGRYVRVEEEQSQRAYTQEELMRWLAETGFCGIRIYGDCVMRAPGPEESRWHIVARRPKEKQNP